MLLLLCLCGGLAGAARAQSPEPPTFFRGVDVSHLDRLEAHGAVFRDQGAPGDLLPMLRAHGVNAVRLRLWHTPADGYSGLARTLALARRVKSEGLAFLLDLHYSDTWADPGQQTKPRAWNGLAYDVLRDSVRTYTQAVVAAFKAQGTLPDVVQIGNEVTSGMLWPEGRVGGAYDNQWPQFAGLLKAGIEGLRAALAPGDSVEVMVHIDRGGNRSVSRWFFDHLAAEGVDFDLIGLSYYYFYGRSQLSALRLNMNDLAERYGKGVVVVETAYPWTLGWSDNTHNPVGAAEHVHPGYPATVEGQKLFLQDLFATVAGVRDGLGRGVFYWEPEKIAVPGVGSDWENLALFDFQGNLLASADAFRPTGTAVEAAPEPPGLAGVYSFPNPFDAATEIGYTLAEAAAVDVRVYDLLGREVAVLLAGAAQPAGPMRVRLDGARLAGGVYLYRIRTAKGALASGLVMLRK